MIYLLTGQPRNGKTQYAIKMILDLVADNRKRIDKGKPARQIYCNIAGVNAEDAKVRLPCQNQDVVFAGQKLWFGEHDDPAKPDDYVCPELGSVFIYDECHKVSWIKERSGTLSDDPSCYSLNEHGHCDYIFILITQFPQYVHTHIRGLIQEHYHVKRNFGFRSAKVYRWDEYQLNPRSDTSIKNAYQVDRFRFSSKYQDCYKSASAHDSVKVHIPKPLYYVAGGLLLIGMLIYNQYQKSALLKNMVATQVGDTSAKTAPNAPDLTQQPKDTQTDPKTQNQHLTLTKEQIEAQIKLQQEQFELELAKQRAAMQMQYAELQQQLTAQQEQLDDYYRRLEMYRKQLPRDYRIQKSDPNLQVRAVVKRGNDCKAYNASGDLMTLTFDECNYYLQATGRVHKTQGNTVNQLQLTPVHQLMDNPAYNQRPPEPTAAAEGKEPRGDAPDNNAGGAGQK